MIPLRCSHAACRLPWGHVVNGVLMVGSRHAGDHHLNSVALTVLYRTFTLSRQPQAGWDALGAEDYAFTTVRPARIVIPVFVEPVAGLEFVCAHCTRPWAYVVNGCLFVESNHGGESHINSIGDVAVKAIFGKKYKVGESVDPTPKGGGL